MRLALLLIATAAAVPAQEPRVVNARLETRTASLVEEIARTQGPAWIGYAVPSVRKDISACCGEGWRGCGLEKRTATSPSATINPGPVLLEGSGHLAVLMRVAGGQVERIRAFALDCALDAGGLPFVWLTGVSPAASAAFLEKHVAERSGKDALPALSMQEGAEADQALVRLARDQQAGRARGDAMFWLSQRASRKAVGAIEQAIEQDPDTEVKKKAVFALSQLPKDEGIPKLIEVAKGNRNPAVRKQAMFWLGQSNDTRAFQFLEQILLKP